MNTPRCETARCVEYIQKYGERYHSVYEDRVKNGEYRCEQCGAEKKGNSEWISQCKNCGNRVDNGSLVGLFVPTMCKKCYDDIVSYQKAHGHVCLMCRQVYAECCC